MKIFYTGTIDGTQTINLGGLKGGNTHPYELYAEGAITVKGIIGSTKYNVGAYSALTYEKATPESGGVFVFLVSPYEAVEVSGNGKITIYC